jgi:hypothetical protein
MPSARPLTRPRQAWSAAASARRQSSSLDDAKGPYGPPTYARTAPGSTESATKRQTPVRNAAFHDFNHCTRAGGRLEDARISDARQAQKAADDSMKANHANLNQMGSGRTQTPNQTAGFNQMQLAQIGQLVRHGDKPT